MKDLLKIITAHFSNCNYYNGISNYEVVEYYHKEKIVIDFKGIKVVVKDYRILNNIICFRYKISDKNYRIESSVYVNDDVYPSFKIIKKYERFCICS